jgi:hypothetical protein
MSSPQKEYEEQTIISPLASWVILIVFSAIIMGWGMFVEMIVMTPPPQWDFGVLPDTPGQSQYSTAAPPPDINVPYQIQRLPDVQLPPGEIKQ